MSPLVVTSSVSWSRESNSDSSHRYACIIGVFWGIHSLSPRSSTTICVHPLHSARITTIEANLTCRPPHTLITTPSVSPTRRVSTGLMPQKNKLSVVHGRRTLPRELSASHRGCIASTFDVGSPGAGASRFPGPVDPGSPSAYHSTQPSWAVPSPAPSSMGCAACLSN